MSEVNTEFEAGTFKSLTPEEHYETGMLHLALSTGDGAADAQFHLTAAVAHALLGGLRDGLDYVARQRVSEPRPPDYAPRFEEDDRP